MVKGRIGSRRAVIGGIAFGALTLMGALPVMPAAAAGGSPMKVFTADVLPGLSALPASPVDSGTEIQVGVTMAIPNKAAQDAAYRAIYTPGGPSYHHFLSAQQVVDQFGVPSATFARVVAWATRAGMRPVFASNTRDYLLLAGTPAQAEQTFSVTLRQFQRSGASIYANLQGPTVPADLGIAGVIGLNNALRAHTFASTRKSAAPPAPGGAGWNGGGGHAQPHQSTCGGGECVGLTTPQDLWSIYGQPTNLADASKNFGQGQQMAVLGEGAVSGVLADLRAFENEFGLPHMPITIQSVNDNFQDTSGSTEWDIDSQASTGMAPKAYGETWIFAKDLSDASVLTDFQAFESNPAVMQANASFGECETDPSSPVSSNPPGTGPGGLAGTASAMFTAGSETALTNANLQGKTLFASTGDTGSSCPVVAAAVIGAGNGVANQGYPETNYPASSPHVVAVGGTVLYSTTNTLTPPASNATRAQETAWTHTGGGNTFYIPEPAFQQGITMLDTQLCVSHPDGTPYTSPTPCRGIPDVAAQSGDVPSNGYAVTMAGVPDGQGGGTSLSSPLWMGMWARIQAASSLTNSSGYHTQGFADPALYTVGKNATQDLTDFFDVGGGPPTSPPTSNGAYGSLPRSAADPSGWDYVSGLGSPNVTLLGEDITGNKTFAPTNPLVQNQPTDCGQPGLLPCSGGGATCSLLSGLWTNPPHTATDLLGNSDPQLSLLHGAMTVSADNTTLESYLTVTNLSQTVPSGAGAAEWYFLWNYGGTVYFANAELASTPGSVPTFSDGTVTVTGTTHSFNTVNTGDTGHFTLGPNGVVQVNVPLAHVGSPPPSSAVLTGPTGETRILLGAAGSGSLPLVDSGGPTCDESLAAGPVTPQPAASVPEVPVAVLLPAAGMLALTPILLRRRRRLRVDARS